MSKTFGELLGSKTRGFINVVKGKKEAKLNAGVMGIGVGYFPVAYRPLPMGDNRFYTRNIKETGGGGKGGLIKFHGIDINASIDNAGGISERGYSIPVQKLTGPMARAWFLSPEITERHHIVQNMRALYKSVGIEVDMGELSLAWIRLHQHDLGDMMSWLGNEDIGFDVHQAYAITGDDIWRRFIVELEKVEPNYMNPDMRPNIHHLMARALLGDTASIFVGQFTSSGQEGIPATPLESVLPEDHQTLVSMERQYDRIAATSTGTLLSYMNKELRARFTTEDPNWTPQPSREVTIAPEADMPEEHVLDQVEGVQKLGTRGEQTIGFNKSMDYAYSMGGRVHIGDFTNMEITSGMKHGQTRGKIMTKKEVDGAIARNDTDEIKDKIYKYYKHRAIPDYNKAIRAIRDRASVTFRTAEEALSPEQMRSPYGRRSTGPLGKGMFAKGAQPWEGGQNIRGAALNEISLSNRATLKYITRAAFGVGKAEAAASATDFVNHILSEWHTHQGAFTQNLTVSKNPFLTAAIELEMWRSGADKCLFKHQAFAEENVRIQSGYALLAMMEEAGNISQSEKARIVFDMKAANLLKRANTSASSARINANNETMNRRITSRGHTGSMAVIIPDDYEQEIYKNILDNIDAPNFIEGYGRLHGTTREMMQKGLMYGSNNFNHQLNTIQWQYRREGRFWPHVMSMWGAPYLAQIAQY